MGMAHRGRLNVLANLLQKSFEFIFEEFSENFVPDTVEGDGDVKYHLGYEAVLDTSSGRKVEVRLAANPSHLEAVNPVVEGKAARPPAPPRRHRAPARSCRCSSTATRRLPARALSPRC